MQWKASLAALQPIEQIKKAKPLLLHITNTVTINDCANISLAIGASPIMSFYEPEYEELLAATAALVLNTGYLPSTNPTSLFLTAGRLANQRGIPIVLDPVGAGATTARTRLVNQILDQVEVSVIKGNLGEIKTLAGLEGKMRGVDSIDEDGDQVVAATRLARMRNCVVAVSGAEDVITDGEQVFILENGDSQLAQVSGTGCMTASLIGAYLGVEAPPLLAAIAGLLSMTIAGEQAAHLPETAGIGTFKGRLFDEISTLTTAKLTQRGVIQYETIP